MILLLCLNSVFSSSNFCASRGGALAGTASSNRPTSEDNLNYPRPIATAIFITQQAPQTPNNASTQRFTPKSSADFAHAISFSGSLLTGLLSSPDSNKSSLEENILNIAIHTSLCGLLISIPAYLCTRTYSFDTRDPHAEYYENLSNKFKTDILAYGAGLTLAAGFKHVAQHKAYS